MIGNNQGSGRNHNISNNVASGHEGVKKETGRVRETGVDETKVLCETAVVVVMR